MHNLPRFSRVARQFLNQHFANKWIGRGGPIAWPARSPDLNPLDFHLWRHLKSIVYTQHGLNMLEYYEIEQSKDKFEKHQERQRE